MTNTPRDTPPSPPSPDATGAPKGTHLIRTLDEVALYPPHPPRRPTALYTKTHHQMVVVEDQGCFKCHVRNSDLHDPKRRNDPVINPVGASAIETHHRLCEDSLANAAHLPYFNAHVRPGLYKQAKERGLPDAEDFAHDMTQEQMLEFIHGHRLNLMPLCDRHHRHPLISIHAITGPIFDVQDMLIPGYNLTGFFAYTPAEATALANLPTTTGEVRLLDAEPAATSDASNAGMDDDGAPIPATAPHEDAQGRATPGGAS